MRLELTGRNVQITPALRRLVEAKLSKLERLLNDSAVSAQVVLNRDKFRLRSEITLHARGEKFLRGVGTAEAWESTVTQAIAKIVQQAKTVKGKWKERKRRGTGRRTPAVEAAPAAPDAAAAPVRPRMPRILRASRQVVKAMSVAEAAREVDARRDGVLVFRDADRESISVLYRRKDGELTLVETEA